MTSGWDAWGQDDDWERWTARPPRVQRERVERPSRERARTPAVLTSAAVLLWIAGLVAVAQHAHEWGVPLGGPRPSDVDGASPNQLDHVRGLWGMLQLTTLPVMAVLAAAAGWSARRRRMRWSPAVAMVLSAAGGVVGIALVMQGLHTWSLSR